MSDMLALHDVKRRKNRKLTFIEAYNFWRKHLFERCINLFTWKGLPMPQREIEFALLTKGYCGYVLHNNEQIATYGGMFGVTNYADVFVGYTFATPKTQGTKKIGVDCVIINSNQTRLSLMPLIDRYSVLLAHADLSLQCVAINSRSTGALGVDNQSQADSVASYYKALEDGKTLAIVDSQSMDSLLKAQGVRQVGTSYPTSTSIKDFYNLTRDLLQSFYSDLGLRMLNEKRERLIESEIDANDNMLLFNIDDMLKSRIEACEEINKLFNMNISVELNKSFVNETEREVDNE